MASNQVTLAADMREQTGKAAAGRLRRDGKTPAVLYGYEVDSTALTVDALDLYHALHTEAGGNVLIRLQLNGDEHLAVAREIQKHPVRGDVQHVDFIAVDPEEPISVEVPVHLVDEDSARESGGVVNLVVYALPIRVKPDAVPNSVELSVEGMEIGDVRRVSDIEIPEDAEYDIDPERTVVTINAPDILEEPSEEEAALEALEGLTEEQLAALEEIAEEEAEELEGEEAEEGISAAAAGPGAAVPTTDDDE